MQKALNLKAVEAALERGDYSLCLELLESIKQNNLPESKERDRIKMLIVTAYMGSGEDQKAIQVCRQLIHDKDTGMRQEAKQLLAVLEAPSLPRPKAWSIEIPNIDMDTATKTRLKTLSSSNSNKKKKQTLPPTGETKNLGFGFSVIVLIVLLFLTFLLSGCVQITSNFELQGPDKIKMVSEIKSNSGKLLPWQIQFAKALRKFSSEVQVTTSEEKQRIESAPLGSEELNQTFSSLANAAAVASGFNIESPKITLNEKNWFIGVQQDLLLTYDLRNIPRIPGLDLSINIFPLHSKTKLNTKPIEAEINNNRLSWPLKQAQINQLHLFNWQWNKLGIGLILIFILTILVTILQKLRLKMGFGFPELPP